jgi:hypothetical protein
MPGMSTVAEAIPSNLQPCYCFSLTILRPSVFCPRLLLEGRQQIGLFLHTLKSIGREEHSEGLLSREGVGLPCVVWGSGRECHGWFEC